MAFVVTGLFCQNAHPLASSPAHATEENGLSLSGAEFVRAPDGKAQHRVADFSRGDVEESFDFDIFGEKQLGKASSDGAASRDHDAVLSHLFQASQVAGLGRVHAQFGIVVVAAGQSGR